MKKNDLVYFVGIEHRKFDDKNRITLDFENRPKSRVLIIPRNINSNIYLEGILIDEISRRRRKQICKFPYVLKNIDTRDRILIPEKYKKLISSENSVIYMGFNSYFKLCSTEDYISQLE